ncbi:hypothetical protein Leryth_012916 [Lithospermum erythrorhizon]|nr:hypothetical protein Leryth_012916 [Lithospermum erythrorhizon]
MRAQNGGVHLNNFFNASFVGPTTSGVHGGFLVGPVPRGSIFGAGAGGGGGPSYGIPSRLDFYDVGQRGNVFGQLGQFYGQNKYDPTSRIENVTCPRFSQTTRFYEGQMDNFVPRNSNYNDKLLYEFKHMSDNYCIKYFKGLIVSFAQDQSWSKILQKKIEEKNVDDIEFVVAEVVDYVCDLMKNQFGGYFIQKLFGMCNEDQRTRIIVAATRMSFELVNVCLCSHGAKTVQILMENLNTPQQISLVISALSTGAVVLSSDPHGQHVIRCCLTNFSYEFNKLLLDKIVQNCIKIATNKSGCCVLQLCVEHSHGELRERLIDEVIANAIHLAQDPFGNYVVQHLVGLGIPEITADLIQHLRGKFTTLSCNKFASNVVEKFLLESGEEHATTIIEDLLENSKAASMLLINPYGNFVIQTALTVSQGKVFEKLLDLILENAPSMRNNIYAEKIFAWFEKRNVSLGTFMNK